MLAFLSYLQFILFLRGIVWETKEEGESEAAQSRKRKMLVCEQHEDEEASCGGHKSAETQAIRSQEGEQEERGDSERQRRRRSDVCSDAGARQQRARETDGERLTQGDVRSSVWAEMRSDVDRLKPGV